MKPKNVDALDVISMKISCLKAQLENPNLTYDELECISNADFIIPLLITLDQDNGYQVTLTVFRNGKIYEDKIYSGGNKEIGWMIYMNVGDSLEVTGAIIEDGVYNM